MNIDPRPLDDIKYWAQEMEAMKNILIEHTTKFNTKTDESGEFHFSRIEAYEAMQDVVQQNANVMNFIDCVPALEAYIKELEKPFWKKLFRK